MDTTQKTIGTHSGTFHMDEVLGVVMLTKYTKEWQNAKLTRTRDTKILDTLDLILDVGAKYEPERLRFDHHQREFNTFFSSQHKIKLSSAGLIYKHYGKEALRTCTESLLKHYNVDLKIEEEDFELIYQRIYDNFIMYVDAVDNGYDQYPKEVKPLYKINSHLATRVARLNPSSYEKASDDERF